MTGVVSVLFDDIDTLRTTRTAGAINYAPSAAAPEGMSFVCPCGCASEGYLAFSGSGSPGPAWAWNGDLNCPTLRPSVFNTGMPCRWHGFLTNGVWLAV